MHYGPLVAGGYPSGSTYAGTSGVDNLSGTSGADTFNNPNDGSKVDTLTGGAGDDVYYVEHEDQIVEAAGGGLDIMLGYSNLTQRAGVEVLRSLATYGTYVTGNSEKNLLIGTVGEYSFRGREGADVMISGEFADDFDGGNEAGIVDHVVELGAYSQYTRSTDGASTIFARNGASDWLTYVEKVHFSDGVYDIATQSFSAYNWTAASTADLTDAAVTQAYLNLGSVFDIDGGQALFIDGDAGDIISVQTLALVKYDAALTRNGSTYDHYAYGTNHIFVEQGLVLTNEPGSAGNMMLFEPEGGISEQESNVAFASEGEVMPLSYYDRWNSYEAISPMFTHVVL